MPASKHTDKWEHKILFSLSDKIKTQKMNAQESRDLKKFEKNVREKGGVVFIFIWLYLHFCYN